MLAAERRGAPFLLWRAESGEHIVRDIGEAGSLTVGRGPEHAVALAWDEEVSWTHAELRRVGSEWLLVDDGLSTNGTFVNGERVIGSRRLREGDTVRAGRTSILFRAPQGGPVTVPAGASGVPVVGELTSTQRGVLVALCRPVASGQASPASNPQIAAEVYLSVDAVKDHLRTLYRKFGLSELAQFEKRSRLADEALRWGLVTDRELKERTAP